jgi:outer membrane protein TolC
MKFRALFWSAMIALCVAAGGRGRIFAQSKAKVPQEIEWKSAAPKQAIQRASAQIELPKAANLEKSKEPPGELPAPVRMIDGIKPLPINLATAMQLANARPLDVQIAARQVLIAAAQFDRAKWQWVPSLLGGADYFHHDGPVQNFAAETVVRSRTSFMVGGSLNATFGLNDAIFGPLASRQDLRARRALLQAVSNDTALAVAEAYFNVQQARGELAGALAYVKEAEELSRRTGQLAEGLSPPMEATRARVELARRQQSVSTLKERWKTASAELLRLIRLDASAVVEPVEPESLTIQLVDSTHALDDLIIMGLTSRPELAANQAFVNATLQRLRQEKMRPLMPSLLVRGASTNPAGTLAYGSFAAGAGGNVSGFQSRLDYDVQMLWELQNFGLGNKARINEKRAERDVAALELLRTQDRVAAEIVQAHAQVKSATERLAVAEPALKDALDLLKKNMEGLTQTRRVGNVLILVVRPQEAVAALQSLAQANADYHAAAGDYNRAQFRLFRALGQPAQCLPNLTAK